MINLMCIIPHKHHATSFYRATGPLSALRKQFSGTHINIITSNSLSWDTIRMADIVFMQRPYGQADLKVAHLARAWDIPLWIDYDDALDLIPPSNPAHFSYRDPHSYYELVKAATVVTVSTKALKDSLDRACKYTEANSKVEVIENALDDHFLKLKEKFYKSDRQEKLVTWRGSNTHEADIISEIKNIEKAMDYYHDHSFLFLGHASPTIMSLPDKRIAFSDFVDLREFLGTMLMAKPTAHLVPLKNNEFNKCKSNIAWIEATLAGARVLATPLPEFCKPGCGTIDDPESGDQKLSMEYILDNLMLSKVNLKRWNVIEKLLSKEVKQ